MMRVNIIGVDNGAGLSRNIEILFSILREKMEVHVTRMPDDRRHDFAARAGRAGLRVKNHQACRLYRFPSFKYDVNLFLEHIWPEWLSCARKNILLPNQEWFREECMPYLDCMDMVMCKTRHAEEIFSRLDCPVCYTSFASEDRMLPDVPRDYNKLIHIPGKSLLKGTGLIVSIWKKHPDWPRLKSFQSHSSAPIERLPNVEFVTDYLPNDELRYLQNTHSLHLCPSESEAFGHYIDEAMSAGALTVVTDAPPMNELAAADRAIMVEYRSSEPLLLGMRYYVDPESLEERIGGALSMDISEKRRMGNRAREWYTENAEMFRRKTIELFMGL